MRSTRRIQNIFRRVPSALLRRRDEAARDEVAGEDEEEIDADPARPQERVDAHGDLVDERRPRSAGSSPGNVHAKWNIRTRSTAMPRMPSSVGIARASAPFSAALRGVVELVGLRRRVRRELVEATRRPSRSCGSRARSTSPNASTIDDVDARRDRAEASRRARRASLASVVAVDHLAAEQIAARDRRVARGGASRSASFSKPRLSMYASSAALTSTVSTMSSEFRSPRLYS